MKKSTLVAASLLTLAGLAGSHVAMAQQAPHQIFARFECPRVSGGVVSDRLTNFGTYISGMGKEDLDHSQKTRPIFAGPTTSDIPSDLTTGGYSNLGTLYFPSSGRVQCNYVSNMGYDSFHVSYDIVQGKGGFVMKSENTKITIILPIGLTASK